MSKNNLFTRLKTGEKAEQPSWNKIIVATLGVALIFSVVAFRHACL